MGVTFKDWGLEVKWNLFARDLFKSYDIESEEVYDPILILRIC